MGKGISMLRPGNEQGEPDTTAFTPFSSRPIPRALMRSLACWLALQTALAVPLASLASAATANAPASTTASGTMSATATGVGAVPPPGPAMPFNRATIEQAPLAVPVPAFAQAASGALGASAVPAVRTLASKTPTTAEPGTLVPGGRRQTLTFSDLGALDPLQLHGTDGQNGVPVSVRSDEVVTNAVLHLIYSYSPSLLPSISQLKVLVNGEVAATLPVPREQAGILVARDVSIDPRFITEFNHLNVQLIGHYTTSCEDPANSSLWATVSNASSLDLTYASLASTPDLDALPQPFFDRRDVRRLELPFVFADKPS